MEKSEYTTFPEVESDVTPLELYLLTHSQIITPRNEVFFSHPITSAGVRSFFINENFSETPQIEVPLDERVGKIIEANRSLAISLANNTQYSEKSTLPAHFGYKPTWQEFDYTKFWFYYISGIDVESAQDFDAISNNILHDKKTFNDYYSKNEIRSEQYKDLVNSYTNFIASDTVNLNPVSTIVFLPDAENSLGCQTEKILADALSIPTSFIEIHTPIEIVDEYASTQDRIYGYCSEREILPIIPQEINPEEKKEFEKIYQDVLKEINLQNNTPQQVPLKLNDV